MKVVIAILISEKSHHLLFSFSSCPLILLVCFHNWVSTSAACEAKICSPLLSLYSPDFLMNCRFIYNIIYYKRVISEEFSFSTEEAVYPWHPRSILVHNDSIKTRDTQVTRGGIWLVQSKSNTVSTFSISSMFEDVKACSVYAWRVEKRYADIIFFPSQYQFWCLNSGYQSMWYDCHHCCMAWLWLNPS